MNQYRNEIKNKGWNLSQVAARWGVSAKTLKRVVENPKSKDWDALEGLPDLHEDVSNEKILLLVNDLSYLLENHYPEIINLRSEIELLMVSGSVRFSLENLEANRVEIFLALLILQNKYDLKQT